MTGKRNKSSGSACQERINKRVRPSDDSHSDKEQNENNGAENPPPKKNRTRQVDILHVCGPCSVWSQFGGKEEHLRHHTGAKRHPGPKASEFSSFLSFGEKRVDLKPDSCMCNSCHRDCLRGINRPRWYTLHEKRNIITAVYVVVMYALVTPLMHGALQFGVVTNNNG